MKKVLTLVILMVTLLVAGCTEDNQNPQSSVTSAQNAEMTDADASGSVQMVQVTQPVTFRSDAFWEWHEQTISILESKVGTYVRIYAYGIQYKGELIEVNDFYIILYDNVAGEIYVSIDTISAIGGELENTKI